MYTSFRLIVLDSHRLDVWNNLNKTSAAILKQSSGCINFKRVRRSKREGETDRDRDKDKRRQNNGESLSARVYCICVCV